MNKLILVVLAMLFAGSANAAILCESLNGGSPYLPATLAAAATSNSCRNTSVVVTSALSAVQSNISSATVHAWPADRALKVEKGGSINPSTTFTGIVGDVSPQWFGAKGDGTTDDTAAINKAIAAISSGKVVSHTPHKITSAILLKSNVQLELHNTLDASALYLASPPVDPEAGAAVLISGTSVSTTTLTVEGAEGGVALTVASVAGLAVNDMLVVELSSDFSGSATGDGIDSHLAKITDITGLVVTINSPLPKTFPIADALVRKVNLIENSSAYVQKVIGAPYHGFLLKWARNCSVSGEVNPVGKNGIYIHRAFANKVSGLVVKNPLSTESPMGYGFLIDYGSADNTIENSYFEDVRECSTGHNARRNIIRNNDIIRPVDNGLNTHGLGESDNIFEHNRIINSAQYGIVFGQLAPSGKAVDRRNIARHNLIIGSASYGIREIQFSVSGVSSNTIIEGNTIRNNKATAIYIGGSGTNTDYTNPTIRGNIIENTTGRGIELSGASVYQAKVTDNTIKNTTEDGILLNSSRGGNTITLNQIVDSDSYGIRELQSADNTLSDNRYITNRIVSPGGTAILLNAAGTNRIRSEVTNNHIYNVGSADGRGVEVTGAGVVDTIIDGNTIDTTTGDGIIHNNAGNGIIIRNNVVRNAGGYGIRGTAGARILLFNNSVESSTSAAYLNLGLAMPTSGTWKVGDLMPYYGTAKTPLNGWRRITTGSDNVLDTDWVAN